MMRWLGIHSFQGSRLSQFVILNLIGLLLRRRCLLVRIFLLLRNIAVRRMPGSSFAIVTILTLCIFARIGFITLRWVFMRWSMGRMLLSKCLPLLLLRRHGRLSILLKGLANIV